MNAEEQLEQQVQALLRMRQQLDRETIAAYRKLEGQYIAALRDIQAKLRRGVEEDASTALPSQ